jgi:6-phosphogluconolactonase (cycloisomerase 2 family)
MFNSLGAAALFLLDVASAATLFASHYSGTINVLTLTGSGTSYSLTQSSSLKIQGQPSWLTFDTSSRTLYAADETTFGSGSVTSISASTSGILVQTGRVTAVGGGVANVVYGTGSTTFIATAH